MLIKISVNLPYMNAYNFIMQVITEKTPFKGDIIGVSSFGFLNAFSHVILKKNNKVKEIFKNINSNDYIPRLILASGRNEENARATVKKVNQYLNSILLFKLYIIILCNLNISYILF